MTAKFIVLSLFVVSVCGSNDNSSVSYGVSESNTGDIKDLHERDYGDNVVGNYSLLEPDGAKNIVEYEANSSTGLNAVVRKELTVGINPSGPVGNESLVGPANGSVTPAHPTSILIPTQPSPIAVVDLQIPSGQISEPNSRPSLDTITQPGALTPTIALVPSSGVPSLSSLIHASRQSHPGGLPAPDILAFTDTLGPQRTLVQSGAFSHQTVFAQHLSRGQHGIPSHLGAIASLANSAGITHRSPVNPQVNQLAGNNIHPGNTLLTSANGYGSPITGPQGLPALSHLSHPVVYEAPLAYTGPQPLGYNRGYSEAYGSAYGGYGSAYGGYEAYGQHGAFGAPLARGLASPLDRGITNNHDVAHSYNSVTRVAAFPRGYGGYGTRYNTPYGAAVGAGPTW